MKKTTGDELVFKDVNPCSKCGSVKINFCYRFIPIHYEIDGKVMAMYECNGQDHKHSILEPDLRAYGKNLKIAMLRAKKVMEQKQSKKQKSEG